MRILLDEMFAGHKPYLQAMGYEVSTAQETNLQGKEDLDVAKYAFNNNFILITQDALPAELSDILKGKGIQIKTKDIARLMDILIKEKFGIE